MPYLKQIGHFFLAPFTAYFDLDHDLSSYFFGSKWNKMAC